MKSFRLLAGIFALMLALPGYAQEDEVQLETRKLTDHIYVVTGAGGNVGVSVGEDGVFIIDDKVRAVTPALKAALDEITDQDVRFVFNTHWHGDHTGGNEHFGKAGAVIVAQENVRERLSEAEFTETVKNQARPASDAALPVITFTDSLTFYLNGDTIQVTHVPHAHTDGDSLLYFEPANVLHMGDTYFASGYPFIDLESGGSIGGMIRAAEKGLEIAHSETQIIPGHGPVSSKADLERYHHMLSTVAERVRALKSQGKSLEAVQAAGVTDEFDERWGGGFINSGEFIEAVYNSLHGE